MVDTTRAMESDYINVDLVRDSPTKKAIFLDEGEYTSMEYQGKTYDKFNITVEIDGKKKIWSPNKDSVKNISEEYGVDSKKWIGRVVAFRIIKMNGKDTIAGLPMLV